MWRCCCCCRNNHEINLGDDESSGEDVIIYEATILDVDKLPEDKSLPTKFDPGSSIASESIAEEEDDSYCSSSNSSTLSRQTIIYVSRNEDDIRAESTRSLPVGIGLNFDGKIDCNSIFTVDDLQLVSPGQEMYSAYKKAISGRALIMQAAPLVPFFRDI